MPELSGTPQRFQAQWEGLQLVVEKRPHYWQAFVYDPEKCEVLHTETRFDVDEAKEASVGFAANYVFGPSHGLKLGVIVTMLVWEPAES
jgi:hypothetical protein